MNKNTKTLQINVCEVFLCPNQKVRKILINPVYIGHMVQGKVKSRFDFGLKPKRLPQDNWIIVENTHEPIIEIKIFYGIQRHRKL